MDEPKVFDIAKPKPSNGTRPVINPIPAADPMVKAEKPAVPKIETTDESTSQSIKVNVVPAAAPVVPGAPAPTIETPETNVPEEPQPSAEPEITNIPVSQAPAPAPVVEAVVQPVEAPSAVSPALPGVSGTSFDNIPKFGELQPKIDAHPLFSGKKDDRVKIRRMPKFAMPLATLIVLFLVGYLAVDAGAIRGYSHLPYHFFKPKQVAEAPVITTPTAQAASSSNTQAATSSSTNTSTTTDNSLKNYKLKYEKLSFKYPSTWTLKDSSSNGADTVALTGANNFEMDISSGSLGRISADSPTPVVGAKVVTFAGQQGYLDFISNSNDKLVESVNLSKSSSNGFDYFLSKVKGQNTGANLVISAAYSANTALKGVSLATATADPNYQDAQNVITSMSY